MKTKAKPKKNTVISDAEEAQHLVARATKQPGVSELLSVYESWQRFDQVLETQNRFTAPRQIVSTSSSSLPLPCEAA